MTTTQGLNGVTITVKDAEDAMIAAIAVALLRRGQFSGEEWRHEKSQMDRFHTQSPLLASVLHDSLVSTISDFLGSRAVSIPTTQPNKFSSQWKRTQGKRLTF